MWEFFFLWGREEGEVRRGGGRTSEGIISIIHLAEMFPSVCYLVPVLLYFSLFPPLSPYTNKSRVEQQ